MAVHELSSHFDYFFRRINPSTSFTDVASRQYATIKGLLEDRNGPAAGLAPRCFLQGSYGQQTAIYSINDVDLVALCELWQPGSGGCTGRSYGRDEIFGTIAAPLLADGRYRGKVRYGPNSMCVKVDLGIKVEILPAVFKQGTNDLQAEPFRLYRPERAEWQDGYARYHQGYLSVKNRDDRARGNFIPMIKVLKHLRTLNDLTAVSFHLETLLYAVPDYAFLGSPATFICDVLEYIAATDANTWFLTPVPTPCGDRHLFDEWRLEDWRIFHRFLSIWARGARLARDTVDRRQAIESWQFVIGADYFPAVVS